MGWMRLLGLCASLAFIAASMAMNGMFLHSQGKTPIEAWVFVVLSVAADMWKAILPIGIAEAWQAKRRGKAAAGGVMLAVLLTFSYCSALGYAAMNRGFLAETRIMQSGTLKDLERESRRIDAAIARGEASRAVPVIEGELAKLRVERAWEVSKSCTEIAHREVREFCRAYRAAETELASASEFARLATERTSIREQMARLVGQGARLESDALAAYLGRLTGLGTPTLRDILIVAIALVVELGSAFGLYLSGMGGRAAPVSLRTAPAEPMPASTSMPAKPLSRRIGTRRGHDAAPTSRSVN